MLRCISLINSTHFSFILIKLHQLKQQFTYILLSIFVFLPDATRCHPASGACSAQQLARHTRRPQPQPLSAWPLPLQLPDLCKTPHHHVGLFSLSLCCWRPCHMLWLHSLKNNDSNNTKKVQQLQVIMAHKWGSKEVKTKSEVFECTGGLSVFSLGHILSL